MVAKGVPCWIIKLRVYGVIRVLVCGTFQTTVVDSWKKNGNGNPTVYSYLHAMKMIVDTYSKTEAQIIVSIVVVIHRKSYLFIRNPPKRNSIPNWTHHDILFNVVDTNVDTITRKRVSGAHHVMVSIPNLEIIVLFCFVNSNTAKRLKMPQMTLISLAIVCNHKKNIF